MPGHVKSGGSKGADPDPAPFLFVSFEMKKEDSLKPYDAKKSVWVPDGEGGYDEGMIQEVKGDMIDVKVRILTHCLLMPVILRYFYAHF